jgi:hypothetical protein
MADLLSCIGENAMSDETIATPITEENTTPEIQETLQSVSETDWKSEARKWESRAKADHELAQKWREYEDTQKSEHEKLADELARERAEAAQAKAELLRLRIASERGITGDATKLLKGSTQEELEAEADLLLSLIADQSKPKAPKPDENQGKPAQTVLGQLTKADLKTMSPQEIVAAKAEGRLNELMGQN